MGKKVWVVTGCSKGLGKSLVSKLISEGYLVAALSRNKESLINIFGPENEKFLPLAMKITDEKKGFTHLATIEEITDRDARALFDVNVFGLLNVTRNVLPVMREQKSGHIFNVSSLGAYNVGPLSGLYCATKHAVKAISETLSQEVKSFGIHVTDVKPGFMRTEFFGSSYETTIPENSPYRQLYDENMKFYKGQNGNQAGDPEKAAELYIKVAEMEDPYESLPMGTDSCDGIKEICSNTVKLMEEMRPIAESTNF